MGIDPATLTLVSTVVGLGTSAYGLVKGQAQAKKSERAQARALAAQQNADELKQARERRQQIREARIRMGTAAQNAANQGVSASSGAIGGQGSIATQLSSNLGFLDQVGNLNKVTTSNNYLANKYKAKADTYGNIANLGMTIFSAGGGFNTIFGGVNDFFKGPTDITEKLPNPNAGLQDITAYE